MQARRAHGNLLAACQDDPPPAAFLLDGLDHAAIGHVVYPSVRRPRGVVVASEQSEEEDHRKRPVPSDPLQTHARSLTGESHGRPWVGR
jgi:hypothetical protein